MPVKQLLHLGALDLWQGVSFITIESSVFIPYSCSGDFFKDSQSLIKACVVLINPFKDKKWVFGKINQDDWSDYLQILTYFVIVSYSM